VADTRYKDRNWQVTQTSGEVVSSVANGVMLAMFMELRDELKLIRTYLESIAGVLRCPNFQKLPHMISKIEANTQRRPRKAKKTSHES
jgi:hypothetical protein